MAKNWQEAPYQDYHGEIERIGASYGFNVWVRGDEGMFRKLQKQGVSPRDAVGMYWELPRPMPLEPGRIQVAAVYLGSDNFRGRKLLIKESLEEVIAAPADGMLAVMEMDGEPFPGGYASRVQKDQLAAFEVLYEKEMELSEYEKV